MRSMAVTDVGLGKGEVRTVEAGRDDMRERHSWGPLEILK